MNGSFIAQYFQTAKNHPNENALGFLKQGRLLWMPHWLIHSKIKHFALGLMDLGAMEGGNFYLMPFADPEGVFAFLAALSLGLPTLTVPADLSPAILEDWTRRYPPAFLYSENVLTPAWEKIFSQKKGFRAFIFGGGGPFPPGETHFSFRQTHNRGIMREPVHFDIYRHRRDSLNYQQWLAPFRADEEGRWVERPLTFQDVMDRIGQWERLWKDRKPGKIFAQVDFSKSWDQILGIVWPLASGRQAVLAQEPENWLGPPPLYSPQLAYLTLPGMQRLKEQSGRRRPSFWNRLRSGRWLGGKLQEIWTPGPLPEDTGAFLKSLGIHYREMPRAKLSLEKA